MVITTNFLRKSATKMEAVMRNIFVHSVESVKIPNLFQKQKCLMLNPKSDRLFVEVDTHKATPFRVEITDKRCHIVGFGKAVLGMAVEVERILGANLVSGILSVPCGTLEKFKLPNGHLEIHEGARNNLPDENAHGTAIKIRKFAEELTDDDVLFVLISGGGSALLPLPEDPVTLTEKMQMIRMLVKCGATINELNTFRIAISNIKGGKLAIAAKNAHNVISLVISDIVGDPVDLIASGPTYITGRDYKKMARQIIDKYKLRKELPPAVEEVLKKSHEIKELELTKNHIAIIANNSIAIEAAIAEAKKANLHAVCLSAAIEGDVEELSEIYYKLILAVKQYLDVGSEDLLREECLCILKNLNYQKNFVDDLLATLHGDPKKGLCIVAGGETTVEIKGDGLGGRNQELTLRVLKKFLNESVNFGDVAFLSAGTDGIDGPTTAAGAVATLSTFKKCSSIEITDAHLSNNNSHTFWNKFYPQGHIVTGHTGTNVMDLHIILIPFTA